jgi:SAM-dependent methyltransferase
VFTRSAEIYDAVYSFKDYEKEAADLHAAIARRKRSPGNDLLDVGCGTGGHVAAFGRRYRVEGLDLDPAMLAVARRRHPGVPFHQGDMTDFDLGREFDAVVCLFSSIGYVRTPERLRRAVACLARHARPGGVVLVEPWLAPETYEAGGPHALFVDGPDLKIARMNLSALDGRLSVIEFHYLVARPGGIEHFTERHELALFTEAEYAAAFEAAGLEVERDPAGPMGRGLYIGAKPLGREA